MAKGDPFLIKQLSGNGNTFSYTPAAGVWLAITGRAGYLTHIHLNGTSSPYVYNFIAVPSDVFEDSYSIKTILGDSNTISCDNTNVNISGICLYGIEI